MVYRSNCIWCHVFSCDSADFWHNYKLQESVSTCLPSSLPLHNSSLRVQASTATICPTNSSLALHLFIPLLSLPPPLFPSSPLPLPLAPPLYRPIWLGCPTLPTMSARESLRLLLTVSFTLTNQILGRWVMPVSMGTSVGDQYQDLWTAVQTNDLHPTDLLPAAVYGRH